MRATRPTRTEGRRRAEALRSPRISGPLPGENIYHDNLHTKGGPHGYAGIALPLQFPCLVGKLTEDQFAIANCPSAANVAARTVAKNIGVPARRAAPGVPLVAGVIVISGRKGLVHLLTQQRGAIPPRTRRLPLLSSRSDPQLCLRCSRCPRDFTRSLIRGRRVGRPRSWATSILAIPNFRTHVGQSHSLVHPVHLAVEDVLHLGHLGSLGVDCGREVYVAAMLAKGKTLYKDIWYLYFPAAPYFNSLLYRLFGTRLEVTYIAGSLAALGSAVFLYLSGMRLGSRMAGWVTAVVVLLQAFDRWIFNFPFPYSYASVYGCFIACFFLWLLLLACESTNTGPMLGLGLTAAISLLLKLEFGFACYAALGLFVLQRAASQRSWSRLLKDLGAVLPGVAICGAVLLWMISLGGVNFLLQENMMSWPTSYFMRTYGQFWLAHTGLGLNTQAFVDAGRRAGAFAAGLFTIYAIFFWNARGSRRFFLAGGLVVAMVFLSLRIPYLDLDTALRCFFFPRDIVLYVSLAALPASFLFWRRGRSPRLAAFALLFAFAGLLAFRILLKNQPSEYPVYYNGPAVLSFLLLMFLGIGHVTSSARSRFWSELILSAACLFTVGYHTFQFMTVSKSALSLVRTERGNIWLRKADAENYSAAIDFMTANNNNAQTVLMLPEDPGVYFLSGTASPNRLFEFVPGILAPGSMTDKLLRELAANPPRYLLWSNRLFPEYGAMQFGKDFDRPLGDFLKAHYHRIGLLPPHSGSYMDWHASLWERNPDGAMP